MLTVLVDIQVTAAGVEAFVEATKLNASASLLEPGVDRFELIAERGTGEKFMLIEVYQDDAAAAAHKQTQHYLTWRKAVASLMARPRTSRKFEPSHVSVRDCQ